MKFLSKMENIVINENDDYTCRNLSYIKFKDIDFSIYKPISFFRSDFRGSRFENIKFQNNYFDRADFIASTFINCQFINVNFGACEMKSCFFVDSVFEHCVFDNTSIQESSFQKCILKKQHILVNMKNCEMKFSQIHDCTFERSTTEKIEFESCLLENVDFATMHAECHKFIDCELNNVKLGISYVFSYLLCNTSIKDFQVLYRGKEVSLNSQEEAMKFLEESRTYELINIFFIYRGFDKIPQLLDKILKYLYNNYNPASKAEITNILEALVFYTIHDIITYECFIDCLKCINSIVLPKLNLEDELLFIGYKEKLNHIISDGLYGKNFIASSCNQKALIILHVETENYDEALKISNDFLEKLYQKCNLSTSQELVESRKGSWILTFSVSAMIVVMLPRIVKSYYNLISEIQLKKGFKKKIIKKIESPKISINEMDQLADIVEKLQILEQPEIDVPKQISDIKASL